MIMAMNAARLTCFFEASGWRFRTAATRSLGFMPGVASVLTVRAICGKVQGHRAEASSPFKSSRATRSRHRVPRGRRLRAGQAEGRNDQQPALVGVTGRLIGVVLD